MNREEAIEALKLINLKRVHPFYSWEEMMAVRDMAIEALKEPKQDWIPVSEKLPAPYETVLATGKMEKDKEPLVYMGCVNGRGEWELLGVRNYEDYITSAWQPLPEPYKGE